MGKSGKKSLWQIFVGKWNLHTVIAVAVGAVAYGLLTAFAEVPILTNQHLALAMIVPVLMAALYGPSQTMVTMFFGYFIGALIDQSGLFVDWAVGSAFLGLFVALLPYYGSHVRRGTFTPKHAVIYALCCVLGNAIAFGLITPLFNAIVYGTELEITFLEHIYPGGFPNTAVLVILGIPLLIVLANAFKKRHA